MSKAKHGLAWQDAAGSVSHTRKLQAIPKQGRETFELDSLSMKLGSREHVCRVALCPKPTIRERG